MKISHVDHDYLKRFSVQILRLMLPFLRLPWDLLLRFLHSKTEKTSKSGILEMLPSWYLLSLKPKGKGDCKNLTRLVQFHVSIFLI